MSAEGVKGSPRLFLEKGKSMFLISEEQFRKIEQEMLREQRIRDDELECAACGFVGKSTEFYNLSVHNKFKICPICGTVRFVCDENRGYTKVRKE